jgi:hypothetical protein
MITKKLSKLAIISISTTAMLMTLVTLAALSASRDVTLSGTLTAVDVEVYFDSACTQPCTTVNAGTLDPGSAFTQIVYINNTGTVPATLSMATSNWNPTYAGSYLTLSWNRQNYLLGAGQTVQATLTLTAASNTGNLTTFSFSATITGTQ